MSKLSKFYNGLLTKPPLIFPLVALFHILWLLYTVWLAHTSPLGLDWIQSLWMLAYTTCWIFICDGRKWATIGYILLSCINLGLYYAIRQRYMVGIYTGPMFPLDLLFSFFVLFFYRRLTDARARA